jgi:hypothetical protein
VLRADCGTERLRWRLIRRRYHREHLCGTGSATSGSDTSGRDTSGSACARRFSERESCDGEQWFGLNAELVLDECHELQRFWWVVWERADERQCGHGCA